MAIFSIHTHNTHTFYNCYADFFTVSDILKAFKSLLTVSLGPESETTTKCGFGKEQPEKALIVYQGRISLCEIKPFLLSDRGAFLIKAHGLAKPHSKGTAAERHCGVGSTCHPAPLYDYILPCLLQQHRQRGDSYHLSQKSSLPLRKTLERKNSPLRVKSAGISSSDEPFCKLGRKRDFFFLVQYDLFLAWQRDNGKQS